MHMHQTIHVILWWEPLLATLCDVNVTSVQSSPLDYLRAHHIKREASAMRIDHPPLPAQSTTSHKWVGIVITANKLKSTHMWTCQIMDVYDGYGDTPLLQLGKVTLVTVACQNTGSGEWHTGGMNGNVHKTITSQSTSTPDLIPFTTFMSTPFLLILNLWNGVVMIMAFDFC